jgi:ATP-dependent DNA ligase
MCIKYHKLCIPIIGSGIFRCTRKQVGRSSRKFDTITIKLFTDFMNFDHDTWYASRKFDGVRVLCFISEGVVEFRSREGNVFNTLQVLEKVEF